MTSMKRYIVRIVGPSGYERFLRRGGLVAYDDATVHRTPFAANKTMTGFMKTSAGSGRVSDIVDKDDPERVITY